MCKLMLSWAVCHSEEPGGTWAENGTSGWELVLSSVRLLCRDAGQRVRARMSYLSLWRNRESEVLACCGPLPSVWGLGILFLNPHRPAGCLEIGSEEMSAGRGKGIPHWRSSLLHPAEAKGNIARMELISLHFFFFQTGHFNWDA